MPRSITTLVILTLLTACTWVQLTAEGRSVRLASPSAVGNCTRIGTTNSSTASRVTFVQRGNEKVQNELVTLARNEAGLMGGNTVVGEGIMTAGQQRFIVYNCP